MRSFTKPPREAYLPNKKPRVYVANRQPLPRSTYQREFLTMDAPPSSPLPVPTTENPLTIFQNFSVTPNKVSVYQMEFTGKKVPIVDSKTLDCRQDKYKYLLSYSGPSKSVSSPSGTPDGKAPIAKKKRMT
jgi:hypothetical protein